MILGRGIGINTQGTFIMLDAGLVIWVIICG